VINFYIMTTMQSALDRPPQFAEYVHLFPQLIIKVSFESEPSRW